MAVGEEDLMIGEEDLVVGEDELAVRGSEDADRCRATVLAELEVDGVLAVEDKGMVLVNCFVAARDNGDAAAVDVVDVDGVKDGDGSGGGGNEIMLLDDGTPSSTWVEVSGVVLVLVRTRSADDISLAVGRPPASGAGRPPARPLPPSFPILLARTTLASLATAITTSPSSSSATAGPFSFPVSRTYC